MLLLCLGKNSVFKPSYFYDPITISGGALTCENTIVGATNKLSTDNVEIQKNASLNAMDIVHTSTSGGMRFVCGNVATDADRCITISKTAVNVYSETYLENTTYCKNLWVNGANTLSSNAIRNASGTELQITATSGAVINSFLQRCSGKGSARPLRK